MFSLKVKRHKGEFSLFFMYFKVFLKDLIRKMAPKLNLSKRKFILDKSK